MPFTDKEILETVRMVELETLDIRTTTLGINLLDCADPDLESTCEKVYAKILHHGIAARSFERRFQLADFVEVTGASLENGLLHLDLKRELPEAMKPRTIAITGGGAKKQIEGKAA